MILPTNALHAYMPWRRFKLRDTRAPFPLAHITRWVHLPKLRESLVSKHMYFSYTTAPEHITILYKTLRLCKLWIQAVSHNKPFPAMIQVRLTSLKRVDLAQVKHFVLVPDEAE